MKVSQYYIKLRQLLNSLVTVTDWSLSLPQNVGECNGFIAPLSNIYYWKDASSYTYATAQQEIVLTYLVDRDVLYSNLDLGLFQGIYNDITMKLLNSAAVLELTQIQNQAGLGVEFSEMTSGIGYWLVTIRCVFTLNWVAELEVNNEPAYDINKVLASLWRSRTEEGIEHEPKVRDQIIVVP